MEKICSVLVVLSSNLSVVYLVVYDYDNMTLMVVLRPGMSFDRN